MGQCDRAVATGALEASEMSRCPSLTHPPQSSFWAPALPACCLSRRRELPPDRNRVTVSDGRRGMSPATGGQCPHSPRPQRQAGAQQVRWGKFTHPRGSARLLPLPAALCPWHLLQHPSLRN